MLQKARCKTWGLLVICIIFGLNWWCGGPADSEPVRVGCINQHSQKVSWANLEMLVSTCSREKTELQNGTAKLLHLWIIVWISGSWMKKSAFWSGEREATGICQGKGFHSKLSSLGPACECCHHWALDVVFPGSRADAGKTGVSKGLWFSLLSFTGTGWLISWSHSNQIPENFGYNL